MPSNKHGLIVACWIAAIFVMVGPVAARIASVTTKQGKQFVGELVLETGDKVTLRIEGVTLSIGRDQIERIEYRQTIHEQYDIRRADLDQQDADAWYRLAYWLFENRAYDLALGELKRMGAQYPEDTRVVRLSGVVTARAELAEDPPANQSPKRRIPRPVRKPTLMVLDDPQGHPSPSRLTDQQITAIKVWEIDLDKQPPVTIRREVIDEFLQMYRGQRDVPLGGAREHEFRSLAGHEQLRHFFGVKARSFYNRVNVRGDPPAMKTFRTGIHQRYVLNYCGTTRCHGGGDPEGLTLVRSAPLSDETAYTNFFVLNSYETRRYYMIDRVEPDESLLLQYGMNRDRALAPHPEVSGWRPRLSDADSPEYTKIRDWIHTLHRPTPDYGIELSQPGPEDVEPPTTAPAE